jgi:hypothetical protein
MSSLISRRSFTKLPALLAATSASAAEEEKLQSEFLLDLTLETRLPSAVGAGRLVVPVSGGSFEGPRLKGTIVPPGGDWIVKRPDGSSVLDVRLMLRTDDAQNIYMNWRGVAYPQQSGALYARITPLFETAAAKYAWLNNLVAVGVYRPGKSEIAYRVYQIL